jgi:DNA modification methylase
MGSSGLTDPDSIPEVPDRPVTRLGDIWLLGDHRVGCGDSTSAADVMPVLAGSQPHLMITDPPYGAQYDPGWRARRNLSRGKLAQGKVLHDDRADWREAYALCPGHTAYVWHGAMRGDVVAVGLAACGLQLRAQIIWVKQHFVLSRGDYHWKHECCWYAVREGKTSHWQGDRTQTTVWEFPNNIRSAARGARRVGGTARKSRSRLCAARLSTTAGPASWSTIRFSARATA